MEFLSLKTRVAEELGLDLSTDGEKIGSWVNESYRFLAGMREWSWLFKSNVIQTVSDITNLTASVQAASDSVTLSATLSTSYANNYYIQFSTTDDWYLVSTHTAGTGVFGIVPAYQGSTDLTSGSCIIRRVFYSLASDVDRIIDLRQTITDQTLTYVDPRTFDRQLPDPTTTGTPYAYTTLGLDSERYQRVSFYPIPSAKTNILYRYYKKIEDLVTNTSSPILPDKFHQAIIFTALAMFGHPYIDDTRIQSAERRAKAVVGEMLGQVSSNPNFHPVIQAWDKRGDYRKPHGAQFPPEFGRP